MTEHEDKFGIVDSVVFATVLLISAAIGMYFRFTGGKQKTQQEYMLADRNMSIIPVGFSLMASFMSAITLLGVSSENYMFGTQFMLINVAYIVATPIAAYAYLPVFFRKQYTSAYEYLGHRFGLSCRLLASTAFSLQMILYMGIVLYAPALAFSAVTGLSQVISIVSVGLVCTFYSTIGGMKAVVFTDVFQSLLMFAAVYCVIIKAAVDMGGVSAIWETAINGSRIELWNIDSDPTKRHTVWTQIIGGIFTYMVVHVANQAQVQRLMTLKTLHKAQVALWLNWPILTCLSISTCFAGLAIYSHYAHCDPLLLKTISSPDQLLPLYVAEALGHLPGLLGLFVAGIFSGSLSTVSSAVNSLAAVTVEDYLKPLSQGGFISLSEAKIPVISKCLAFFYGITCLGVAFLAQYLGGILQAALTIFGVVGGPLLALFTLGMFCTCANNKGSSAGFIIGLSFCLWIGFGGTKAKPVPLPRSIEGCVGNTVPDSINNTVLVSSSHVSSFYLYQISYMWYAPLGFVTTMCMGLLASVITGGCKKSHIVDPNLLSPFCRKSMVSEPKIKVNDKAEDDLASAAMIENTSL